MKKIFILILVAMPGFALADLDWGHMSEYDIKMCVEGFGQFKQDQYCMAVDCFSAQSNSVLDKKLDFLSAGFQISQETYESNGRCYFQYWR